MNSLEIPLGDEQMTTTTEGYNGWANYETWAVALWIDNEESTHREAREMVRAARRAAQKQIDDGETFPREAFGILADALEEWVKGMAPDLGATLWSDLLSATLSEVDWSEIATDWLSET